MDLRGAKLLPLARVLVSKIFEMFVHKGTLALKLGLRAGKRPSRRLSWRERSEQDKANQGEVITLKHYN